MWYYYRPQSSRCSLAAADVVTATATVTRSVENTTGKYPEYHKVWEDNELKVVAIFGKYEESGTTTADAGIAAYNAFVSTMRSTFGALGLTTEPAVIPAGPGVERAGRHVRRDARRRQEGQGHRAARRRGELGSRAFYTRYEGLSGSADVIAYNGHAGLGQNVRALANRGKFVPGKYLMFFMNGCDTFAYVDGSLAQTRALLNPDDPTGTKYMDIVTNAMPSFFHSTPGDRRRSSRASWATAAPKTYEQIFATIDTAQVVLVTGEEDNVFTPGMPIGGGGGGGGGAWTGLDESGSVARADEKRYATPQLPAGTLHVRARGDRRRGPLREARRAPTTSSYDCRPYKNGSAETCTVTLAQPGDRERHGARLRGRVDVQAHRDAVNETREAP